NYVHFLLPDVHGNLWFGTNRGIGMLNPLTGQIKKINRTDYPDLRGYIFTHLAFDGNGNLWALSEKNGINRINTQTKQVDVLAIIHSTNAFSCLFSDSENNIWVGTKYGQVFYSPPPYEEFIEVSNPDLGSIGSVNHITEIRTDQILISTETGPL